MKIITVTYTGTYLQDFEVPDDQSTSPQDLLQLAWDLGQECDWSDGGADWRPYMVTINGQDVVVD